MNKPIYVPKGRADLKKPVGDPWEENKMTPVNRIAAIRRRAKATCNDTGCHEFSAAQPWKLEQALVHDGYYHEWASLAGHAYQDIFFLLGEIDRLESEYNAANRRPPNKPLTRKQMKALPCDFIVWRTWVDGVDFGMATTSAKEAGNKALWLYDSFYWFATQPTPDNIEAARGERNQL